MKIQQTEILHETNILIKGNEPFLSFAQTGLILNLNDRYGKSHNFIETPFGSAGIPINKLRKGETLRLQLTRVFDVEPKWYQKIWIWWKNLDREKLCRKC